MNAAETGTRLSCRAVEREICAMWSAWFGHEVVPQDDFFELGGDSLAMIDLVAAGRERGLPMRSSIALRNPTPARLAEALVLGEPPDPDTGTSELPLLRASARQTARTRAADWIPAEGRPAPIGRTGPGMPLYVVHSDNLPSAERAAVSRWNTGFPAYGFGLRGIRTVIPPAGSIDRIAAEMVAGLPPDGPCRLAGFGVGAVLAFEMARQLAERGHGPELVVLIRPPAGAARGGREQLLRQRLAELARRFALTGEETMEQTYARLRADGWYDDATRPWDLPWLQLAWADLMLAVRAYDPPPYAGAVLLADDVADGDRPWLRAAAEVHHFDHGVASPLPLLADDRLTALLCRVLTATAGTGSAGGSVPADGRAGHDGVPRVGIA